MSKFVFRFRLNIIHVYLSFRFLSHNNLCFQCNIAITNFLVSHIRFNDVIGQSTVPMYPTQKFQKHGWLNGEISMFWNFIF